MVVRKTTSATGTVSTNGEMGTSIKVAGLTTSEMVKELSKP